MTTVRVAETAGFCFGVQRAVDLVYKVRQESGEIPVYTYGPIIHNETVVADLERRGVRVLPETGELAAYPLGTVVLRSHGVSRDEEARLREKGFQLVDATCPFVKKIHTIVEKASAAGDEIIIIGDESHPEVQGICGWSHVKPLVTDSESFLEQLDPQKKYTLVSQTTFNQKKFKEIVEKINRCDYNVCVVNTICNATQRRQTEAEEIAASVDAMIVIGGSHSSNTRKLYDICRARCEKTFFIQTLVDLINQGFEPERSVGITAGASTPKNIIEEVHTYVRSKF